MPITPFIQRLGPNTRVAFGDSPPTSGRWTRGSVVVNTAPATSTTPGWVCVASGTPGTWRPIEGYGMLAIPVSLDLLADGARIANNLTFGFPGRIVATRFVVTTPATTANKNATLSIKIGNTDVTGGTVSLTTSNCGTLGAVVNGSAVTANNAFDATSQISVNVATTEQFAEGAGVYLLICAAW